ncbi:MAG TPA: threonine/serine dehydratase [Actinomycetota bacterium]|nr:threonine/serine dehydratase [Actinomycetota bacterium]
MQAVTVGPDDVRDAAERIAGRVRRTPVLELGEMHSASVVAKLELLQHTGSFKPRGAFNKLLSSDVPPAGVIAASGGNFGSAVAYAARETGVAAEIFVPATSPETKVSRVRAHGAHVTVVDGYYAEAQAALGARQEETGALLMHPFDQPEVIAGQGTIGIELDEQVPNVDTVLVAVGGGGLIAGIAAWFRGRVRVIGVEPVTCATMTAALEAGGPVVAEVGGVAADSLGSARVGDHTFPLVRDHVVGVVLVADDAIREAQRAYWDECRLIVEPGGAAAFGALRSGAYVPNVGERVCVLASGANCDPATVTG